MVHNDPNFENVNFKKPYLIYSYVHIILLKLSLCLLFLIVKIFGEKSDLKG